MSILCGLIFIWLNAVTLCQSQSYRSCQGYLSCKWTVDNHTLDLTGFQMIGLNLTGQDNEYTYELTLCNNLFPGAQMVQQTKINFPSEVNYLARYSMNVMPSIQLDSNSAIKSWYFDYSQNFSLQFICDYHQSLTSYMEIVQILEIVPYKYLIQISSLYACDNVTTAPYNLSYDQCIWYNEATSSTLDLRSLYGRVISTYGAYAYTVCQDAYRSSSGGSQCGMWGTTTSSSSHLYGVWDPNVEPLYSSNDGSWTFSYGVNHDNTIKWVCDRTIDSYKVLSYSHGNYNGYLVIASQFACTAPVDCVFIDPDNNENVLDLRDLQGQLYQIINNDDFTYSYQYTPCANFLNCDSKESVMAMRWNIAERECDPYLAVYDGFNGYTLLYNESAVQWRFTYNNGDLCPDEEFPNVEFNIYWTCNQTETNAFITKVDTENACNYSMYIESSYAC